MAVSMPSPAAANQEDKRNSKPRDTAHEGCGTQLTPLSGIMDASEGPYLVGFHRHKGNDSKTRCGWTCTDIARVPLPERTASRCTMGIPPPELLLGCVHAQCDVLLPCK